MVIEPPVLATGAEDLRLKAGGIFQKLPLFTQ